MAAQTMALPFLPLALRRWQKCAAKGYAAMPPRLAYTELYVKLGHHFWQMGFARPLP